jgi:hypothetical protein
VNLYVFVVEGVDGERVQSYIAARGHSEADQEGCAQVPFQIKRRSAYLIARDVRKDYVDILLEGLKRHTLIKESTAGVSG